MTTNAWTTAKRAFFCALFLVTACEGRSLDVGATNGGAPPPTAGSGGTGGAGPYVTLPSWPTPRDCVASSNLDVVGVWEGAVRDLDFETVVPLKLEIFGASEEGGICGTMRWGDRPPPPPPSDPNRQYPEGYTGLAESFYDGATYTLMRGAVSGDRLHFVIATSELWKDWCGLQTPYFHPDLNLHICIPVADSYELLDDGTCRVFREGEPPFDTSNMQCTWCGDSVCICSAENCTAITSYHDLAFDLAVDSNRIQGRFAGYPAFYDELDLSETDILLTRVE